jgi:4-hydroxy-2-oxoheptanedioate aldolase
MMTKQFLSAFGFCFGLGLAAVLSRPASSPPESLYNTVKQKLIAGRQVFAATLTTGDTAVAQKMAKSDYDFLWIEMQHSPMTYETAANLIMACQGLQAVPFIRVPDATEGDIQKATDIGALGIVVPMVDTPEKAMAAVKYAKFPPVGRRSTGSMQAPTLWGKDYRQTANANVMVVVQIETPEGVANVEKIAAVPGVDVVFASSVDLANFSGWNPGEPRYEAMISRIQEATLKAGKWLGGPGSWSGRKGFTFFQGRGAYKET